MATQMSEPPDGDMEDGGAGAGGFGLVKGLRGERKFSVSESLAGAGSGGAGRGYGAQEGPSVSWGKPPTQQSTMDMSTARGSGETDVDDIQASVKQGSG